MSCPSVCNTFDCNTCDCAWANAGTCGNPDGTCCNIFCCDGIAPAKSPTSAPTEEKGGYNAVVIIIIVVSLLISCVLFFYCYLMKWERGEGFTFTTGARETEYVDENGNALSANPLYERQGHWHKVWAPEEDAFYYANEKTGATQWEKPAGFEESAHRLSVE